MSSEPHIESNRSEMKNRNSALFGDAEILAGESLFNHLVDYLAQLLLWLGLLAFIGDILRVMCSRWTPLINVQSAFFFVILAVFLFRKKLGARHTATAILTALYGVSLTGLTVNGPGESSSVLVLSGVIVVSGILFGRRSGLLTALFAAASIALAASTNMYLQIPTFGGTLPTVGDWLNVTLDISAVSIALILFVSAIQKRLLRAVQMNRQENFFTQAVVNAVQDLLFVFNPRTGKMIYWNDSFREFTNLSDDEIEERPIPDAWSDRFKTDLSVIHDAIGRLFTGNKELFELDLVSDNQTPIPTELRASVVDLPENERVVLCMARDIRERRALRETESYLQVVTESLPVVIWALNRDGSLAYISPNVADVCGFTAEELLQDGLRGWIPQVCEEDRGGFTSSIARLLEGGAVSNHRYRFTAKDGRELWLHERGVSTVGNPNEPAACGIFCDITEQVKTSEHLRQSEKLEILGQLAGGVAHDFNNQIAGIIGIAELLEIESNGNGSMERYVHELQKCAHHAASLPQQLLTFSRRDAQHTAPQNVHDIIKETVAILGRSIKKSIRLTPRLSAENPVVDADPSRLQNALLNLCLNARDAMSESGEIVIETKNRNVLDDGNARDGLRPGEYLTLSVKDTGEGMSKETQRRIFEPFFTTKPEGRGTGLGLAMVLGFVKGLEGTVDVTSEVSKGTRIDLTLPVCSPESAVTAPPSVLLVDDEPTVLEMVKGMLQDLGYDVTAFHSAKKALAEYYKRASDFSLVIVDMVMPELSGPEVLSEIKRFNKDARVLLISAMTSEERFQETVSLGALGYLPKPFSQNDLREKVCSVIPPQIPIPMPA